MKEQSEEKLRSSLNLRIENILNVLNTFKSTFTKAPPVVFEIFSNAIDVMKDRILDADKKELIYHHRTLSNELLILSSEMMASAGMSQSEIIQVLSKEKSLSQEFDNFSHTVSMSKEDTLIQELESHILSYSRLLEEQRITKDQCDISPLVTALEKLKVAKESNDETLLSFAFSEADKCADNFVQDLAKALLPTKGGNLH